MLHFRCNICGENSQIETQLLTREFPSCHACGSTARTRATMRVLSISLFGRCLALPDFPESQEITGLGMTDSEGYACALRKKFHYLNTYYHQEPRLDISSKEVPSDLIGSADFIISSEVFEHVIPPVSLAFENVWKMLKPGGAFILTVPYGTQPDTIEHFPELNEFEIIEENGSYSLRNVTKDGTLQEFGDLVFHGGPGSTLEMRVFAEAALPKHLQSAGFEAIEVHRTPDLAHGIAWPEPWSFPISAIKPASHT